MNIYAIGEALIDLLPTDEGYYSAQVGGAPLNAAAAAARLGGHVSLISRVSSDGFGQQIRNTLREFGVSTTHLHTDPFRQTALAVVSLDKAGERSFSFYRENTADTALSPEDLVNFSPQAGDVLHFCSVALSSEKGRAAHHKAIQLVKEAGGRVYFDVNIRLPLWNSTEECIAAVTEFLPLADMVKVSDDELPHLGKRAEDLFIGEVKDVIVTRGSKGALWLRNAEHLAEFAGYSVEVADTTGAGDAFSGAILFLFWDELIPQQKLEFACACGALATTKRGALSSLPTSAEVQQFLQKESP